MSPLETSNNTLCSGLAQQMSLGEKMIQKYPGRVPVIVEDPGHVLMKGSKKRFLVPENYSSQQFMCIVRNKNPDLCHSQVGLFFMINGLSIPPPGKTLGALHNEYRDHLDILKVVINSFGHFHHTHA